MIAFTYLVYQSVHRPPWRELVKAILLAAGFRGRFGKRRRSLRIWTHSVCIAYCFQTARQRPPLRTRAIRDHCRPGCRYHAGRAAGIAICYESIRRLHVAAEPPHLYAIWPMIASIVVKTALSRGKFKFGRRLGSAALVADAWHDGIEIVSGVVALLALALTLTLYDPQHFSAADHWGGFAVRLIVFGRSRILSPRKKGTVPPIGLIQRVSGNQACADSA